jgi:integration host factor subunit beta
MTKSEFINCLAERRNLSIIQAEQVVGTVFDSMSEALVSGERIEIRGFGSFCIKEYFGHTGRNPKSGESVVVKPKKVPRFKVGKPLSERIMGQCLNNRKGGKNDES